MLILMACRIHHYEVCPLSEKGDVQRQTESARGRRDEENTTNCSSPRRLTLSPLTSNTRLRSLGRVVPCKSSTLCTRQVGLQVFMANTER